jgi:iron complex transport system substrate-binding protein
MTYCRQGLFSSLIAVLFLLASCHPAEKESLERSGESVGIEDALGRNIALQNHPIRVVTIAPGASEIVVAAGGLSKLVGVSNVDSDPSETSQLPRFSVLPMDFEAIVALSPDLVFASSQVNDPQHVKVFEALNINVFFLDGSNWDAVFKSIAVAGSLLGSEEEAAQAQAKLEEAKELLVSKTSGLQYKPKSIFLISDATSYSFGPRSYVQELFDWAGARSATSTLSTPAPVLSDEWVLIEDPEIIFGTFGDGFEISDLLKHHPTWNNLTAIKSGKVFSIPQDLILRPGPRNVEAAYLMARKAHPELFIDDVLIQ